MAFSDFLFICLFSYLFMVVVVLGHLSLCTIEPVEPQPEKLSCSSAHSQVRSWVINRCFVVLIWGRSNFLISVTAEKEAGHISRISGMHYQHRGESTGFSLLLPVLGENLFGYQCSSVSERKRNYALLNSDTVWLVKCIYNGVNGWCEGERATDFEEKEYGFS